MKFITTLLLLASFSASAAQIKLTISMKGVEASQLKDPKILFESTNPLCKSVVMTGAGPAVVNRLDSAPAKLTAVNSKTVVIEADTLYPRNNFCDYKLSHVSIHFPGMPWLAISSTRSRDYSGSDEVLNFSKYPTTKFSGVCKDSQCERFADGNRVGYRSNLMDFYVDSEVVEKKSGQLNLAVSVTLK